MRCKHCNGRLAVHDMWCVHCGRQTPIVTTELSTTRSMRDTWLAFKPSFSAGAPLGTFSVIFGAIPILVLLKLLSSFLSFDTNTALGLLGDLLSKSLAASIFVPFLLIGFHAVCKWQDHQPEKFGFGSIITAYPRYFALTLLSAIYYTIIYVICFGLPKFGSDPILRLVWIVLAQYWVVLILPVSILMEEHNCSIIKSLRLSYRHFHVVRWNLYLMLLILVVINGIPMGVSALFFSNALVVMGAAKYILFLLALLVLAPMAYTLPYSWLAVRDYTNRLVEFELVRQ